jgi:hypothetical protein
MCGQEQRFHYILVCRLSAVAKEVQKLLRLDAVLLKVWTIELHASRLGKRPGDAYPNEILL